MSELQKQGSKTPIADMMAPRNSYSAGSKVLEFRSNYGIQIGSVVLTSLVAGKHSSEMETHQSGVVVRFRAPDGKAKTVLVPWGNISFIALE